MATPMTPDQILAALKAEGLTVREYPGWRTRCRCCPDTGPHKPAGPFIRGWGDVNGSVQHITGGGLGRRSVETYIRDIILNDPALPTKCQFVTDPDGVVWLVAAGRANHAGKVGKNVRSHMVAADYSLTDNYDDRYRGAYADGNSFTYGNECIAASKMNDAQRASSVLLWAAIAKFHNWSGQETVGHGEVSSARATADPNLHMGEFRRDIMARVAGGTPKPEPVDPPAPTDDGVLVETISANLAGYDKVWGMRNRVKRAQTTIPGYFNTKSPTWYHFQECAIDMFPELDKRLKGYTRVGAGGKGRQSYHRDDAGIKIIEAKLLNVSHMLLKDTKEHLVIAWEIDGHRGVDVNFHNENEGSTFQPLQLRDVMSSARKMADKHGIPRANILVTGDSNFTGAALFARMQGWTEAIYSAAKKIDLQWRSTNGWVMNLVLGKRIDVDVFQRSADVLEAEQLYGALTGDHWPHRVLRRLVK